MYIELYKFIRDNVILHVHKKIIHVPVLKHMYKDY